MKHWLLESVEVGRWFLLLIVAGLWLSLAVEGKWWTLLASVVLAVAMAIWSHVQVRRMAGTSG